MARVATYLNFSRNTEEAFTFYRSVFGGEYSRGGIVRFKDFPPPPGSPPLRDEDRNLVMHVELPILDGHLLMGTDAPESMGFHLEKGNNVHVELEPDSTEQTDKLFASLSAGGKVTMPMQKTVWGSYFGTCVDKFGVQWMFNFPIGEGR